MSYNGDYAEYHREQWERQRYEEQVSAEAEYQAQTEMAEDEMMKDLRDIAELKVITDNVNEANLYLRDGWELISAATCPTTDGMYDLVFIIGKKREPVVNNQVPF